MDTTTQTPKNIIIYSTPTCGYCHKLKDYLSEKNISFTVIDVAADAAARAECVEKSGQLGVPVTDIEGKIVVGYDVDTINQILGITN